MTTQDFHELSLALVCAAYRLRNDNHSLAGIVCMGNTDEGGVVFPHNILEVWSGQDRETCLQAVRDAQKLGLVEPDTVFGNGALTSDGAALLYQSDLKPVALSIPAIERRAKGFNAAIISAVDGMSDEAKARLAEEYSNEEQGADSETKRSTPRP